jgi:hypothetical protein
MESLPRLNVPTGAVLNVSTEPVASTLVLGSHTTRVQIRLRWRLIFNKWGKLGFPNGRGCKYWCVLGYDIVRFGIDYQSFGGTCFLIIQGVLCRRWWQHVPRKLCSVCIKLHKSACNLKTFWLYSNCYPSLQFIYVAIRLILLFCTVHHPSLSDDYVAEIGYIFFCRQKAKPRFCRCESGRKSTQPQHVCYSPRQPCNCNLRY